MSMKRKHRGMALLLAFLTAAIGQSPPSVTTIAKAEPEPMIVLDSTLQSADDIHTLEGFTLVNWAWGRCGYETARNIYTNTSAHAAMVFDAGDGGSFTNMEFRISTHASSAWQITQQVHLNKLLLASDDGISWTPVAPETYRQEGDPIFSDGNNYYTYTVSWNYESGARFVKLASALGNGYHNQLFVHHALLKGRKSQLLFEDSLEDISKATVVKGFQLSTTAYGNCGFAQKRNVCYRGNETEAFVSYDVRARGTMERIAFEVTVSLQCASLITAPGALDDILYLSADGTEFELASGMEGYQASYELLRTQNNHNTYRITYQVPEDMWAVKFDAQNFSYWQMYLTGVWFYGFAPLRITDELLLDDPVSSMEYMAEYDGWTCGNTEAATNFWQKVGCMAAQDVYYNQETNAYAVYTLHGKILSRIEIRIAVPNDYSMDHLVQANAYISSSIGGSLYTAAVEADFAIQQLESEGAEYDCYQIAAYLPSGTTHVRFAPEATEAGRYFLNGVSLYGTQEDAQAGSSLVLGDMVENFEKAYAQTGFAHNSWLEAKTGLAQPRPTAYKSGNGAYVIYQAPNNGTIEYAEVSVTVNSWDDSWKITEDAQQDRLILASSDGVTFTAIPKADYQLDSIQYDGNLAYSNYQLFCDLPEGTKYLKIDAGTFDNWEFLLTKVLLYGPSTTYDYASLPSLYEVNDTYFDTAVALEPSDMYDYHELLLTQFNEITIENQMKPGVIHPSEDYFSFAGVDQIVAFAQEHGLKVRGHGLVYEKEMPDWFFKDENGNEASKELVMERLENHVRTVVRRYKGKIYCYDVVNEVFGHQGWDTRELSRICDADEYIRKVFQWAHEEDPDAILILNDNYYDIPQKRQNIFNYVKQLVEDGVPIHGIGFQDHHFLDTSLEAVDDTLALFSTISNLKLFVTELDVRAYGIEDTTSVWPDFMEDEIKELVAQKYGSLFDIYRKYADRIETVGLWNICDAESWLDAFYVPGRKHFATLFGYDGEPNPAYWRVIDTAQTLPRWTGGTMIPPIRNNDYTIDTDTDLLTVQGTADGTVTISLFRCFETMTKIYTETQTESGAYTAVIPIDTDDSYTGEASPDYILEVTDATGTKTDRFTYFTREQRTQYYTVTDSLENYAKMYRAKNCMFVNQPDTGERLLTALRFWGSANLGPGEVVYAIPDSFIVDDFEIEMYTATADTYDIYYSADDVTYLPAEMNWQPEDAIDGLQLMKGTALQLPENTKFLKIDLGISATKYLKDVYLTATPDPATMECTYTSTYNTIEVSGKLPAVRASDTVQWRLLHNGSPEGVHASGTLQANADGSYLFDVGITETGMGNCLYTLQVCADNVPAMEETFAYAYQPTYGLRLQDLCLLQGEGEMGATGGCQLKNLSDKPEDTVFILSVYNGNRLKEVAYQNMHCAAGETTEAMVSLPDYVHENGDKIRFFIFNSLTQLSPVFDKILL